MSVRQVDAPVLLENLGGILMTFSMLPLLAASVNLLQTARSGAAQAFSSPAGLAGVLAMFLLPIYAVGAYFSGMETLVGEASLHGLNMALSHGLFFTVGGLLALSATLGYLPQANGRAASTPAVRPPPSGWWPWAVSSRRFLPRCPPSPPARLSAVFPTRTWSKPRWPTWRASISWAPSCSTASPSVSWSRLRSAFASASPPLRPAPRSAATSAPTLFPEAARAFVPSSAVALGSTPELISWR